MSDTPETDAELYPMNGVDIVWPDFARKLERERDEARERIERQKLEINRLNGATNHAGGTPLKIALRERDEAITRRMETIMQCELYEQERDEAREKAERYRLEANAMMLQRDEAREYIERQKLEINRLNGATNHAGGTPLKIALRERDEAITRRIETIMQCELYEQERDEARELLRLASIEANALATSIQKSEYSDVNDFQLCESVAGVISQINNMYAGVREQRDEAREAFKIVYNERVQMELERNEWKNKAYSNATDYTLMEAKCFRLEQQLKEYDQLKS